MKLFQIDNERERTKVIELIKNNRLPFRIFIYDEYPVRSLKLNAYLWGVVYKIIADETGYSADSVHEYYKRKFNTYYKPNSNGEWNFDTHSTSDMDAIEFSKYIDMVIADAMQNIPGIQFPTINDVSF